ncbi:hypothetical protein O181_077580 [Austropuccinia psidii MF-1]|uniref:Retrovirus-related Pol polyprotein from transposon TNT 1-94-like beta-barrel domain-containing protein n=1 Tax=Austropuccinia psidii MF-1 TaxID=1389203 RepID=A0A9Q3IG43_9BASI|nr:hypothetical protein [Austropuccinia psidii MF-1]
MQWIKFTYNGDIPNYIDNSRMLIIARKTVNITVPNECHSFYLLGKLTRDPKIYSYVEVLTLNEDLVKDPELVLANLQEFHDNKLITGNQDLIKPQELIIDCGATHHNSLKCFTSFSKTPEISVSTGDLASTLLSAGIGTIVILCINQSLSLKNSLFVPRPNCNLVSLLAPSQKKVVIHREDDHFTRKTNNFGMIKGKITNNLMRVEYSISENHLTATASNPWHGRLGHPGNQVIRMMGLPVINSAYSTCD